MDKRSALGGKLKEPGAYALLVASVSLQYFWKFVINGVSVSGPTVSIIMKGNYDVEAVYSSTPPPPNRKIKNYKGHGIWQGGVTGLIYVENFSGVIVADLLTTVPDAELWIDTYAPISPLPALVIGGVVAVGLTSKK